MQGNRHRHQANVTLNIQLLYLNLYMFGMKIKTHITLTRMCLPSTSVFQSRPVSEDGERRGLGGLAMDGSKSLRTEWRLHESLESFD